MYHSHALVESEDIGESTRIWAFAHVMRGAKIGKNCNIGDHAFVECGAVIGDDVTIKNGVCVWEGVTIGNGVFVGPNAVFTNDMYPRSPRLDAVQNRYSNRDWLRRTHVHEGVTIGANATIICGITLGSYCFIGASAVVTQDVSSHARMIGCPARERGFVCRCAHTLTADNADVWSCPECRRRYDNTMKEIGFA